MRLAYFDKKKNQPVQQYILDKNILRPSNLYHTKNDRNGRKRFPCFYMTSAALRRVQNNNIFTVMILYTCSDIIRKLKIYIYFLHFIYTLGNRCDRPPPTTRFHFCELKYYNTV